MTDDKKVSMMRQLFVSCKTLYWLGVERLAIFLRRGLKRARWLDEIEYRAFRKRIFNGVYRVDLLASWRRSEAERRWVEGKRSYAPWEK